VSHSSVGTTPLTRKVTVERLGVPQEYASFAVTLSATTKMDGCAAIGSAATAGLTGAVVMLTLTLSTLGLPLAEVGLLIAINSILDMGRTATNVAGQMVVSVLVSRSEGTLDEQV
jgi:Na+/H+-dicarboxylate symporter